ncbi:MAG: hypothetical protein SGILL_006333 [Bacillariaceae sp.]
MPPSSISWSTMASPLCCAFPIGEIEVQAVEDSASSKQPFFTRIIMSSPGQDTPHDDDKDTSTSSEDEVKSPEARSPPSSPGPVSRYDYFAPASAPISPGAKSLADSFDSTDEIVENSNEAKLIKRVIEKRTGGMHYTMESGWEPNNHLASQPSSLSRQDSLSDTNSVNSNDVFMSIDESQEMEYLGVLDQHLMCTDPEEMSYTGMEAQMDDSHPKKNQGVSLDDMIEHLCAAPCGECLPDSPFGDDSRPASALRRSRYSASIRDDSFTAEKDSTKKVKFQDVDIQEFKMTLGNHPSATSGPPVMLDSELFSPRQVMTLEQYEATRPPRRKRRQLKLSLQQRHNILVKERGVAFNDVKNAWQEALEIRKQRKETLERGLALMKWDEVWESTCRKFNRLVGEPI